MVYRVIINRLIFYIIFLSVKSLKEGEKNCFMMLVVFERDTLIPFSVLETIWGESKMMATRVRKSKL